MAQNNDTQLKATEVMRKRWQQDFSQLFDITMSSGEALYQLFLNYISHQIYEQLLEDNSSTEFDVDIAPLGIVHIKFNSTDKSVSVDDIIFDSSFIRTVINTIDRKQSALYEAEYNAVLHKVESQLRQFKGGS